MDVVDDAVTAGELNEVRGQLPAGDGWDELFALVDQEEKPVDEERRSA